MMDPLPIAFSHASVSIQGKRSRQEDHSAVWQPPRSDRAGAAEPLLVVLADGMGGHASGHLASELACRRYIEAFRAAQGEIGPRMMRAVDDCNRAIAAAIADNTDLAGMGCTLVGAYFDPGGLRWVSVGDSTLLIYRDGRLARLNADHSHGGVLDKQAEDGVISWQEAKTAKRRRALRSALTGDRIPMIDIEAQPVRLCPGDWVLIASDGLLTLSGDELAQTLHDHRGGSAGGVVRSLIDAVERRDKPRQDNTTVVAVRIAAADAVASAPGLATSVVQPEPDIDAPTVMGPLARR